MFTDVIRETLDAGAPNGFLWPMPSAKAREQLGTQVRLLLREVCGDPDLGQRSIRRGALQYLSAQGVPEATMMHFSGHSRVETLRRYLSWGRIAGATKRLTAHAGKLLGGETTAEAPQL
jgi:hypothetical protein